MYASGQPICIIYFTYFMFERGFFEFQWHIGLNWSKCVITVTIIFIGCVNRQTRRTLAGLPGSAPGSPPGPQSHVAATPTATQCPHDRLDAAVRTRPAGHTTCDRGVRDPVCAGAAAWPAVECESDGGVAVDGWPHADSIAAWHGQLRTVAMQSAAVHTACVWRSLSLVVVLSSGANLPRVHRQGLHQQTVWKGD